MQTSVGFYLALSTWLLLADIGFANGPCGCSCPPASTSRYRDGAWFVVLTPSFHVCSTRSSDHAECVAEAAETSRKHSAKKWSSRSDEPWNPRCQIVLYERARDYVSAVGRGSDATVASALVKKAQGKVVSRRIDLRCDVPNYLDAGLQHELCHVVLADEFTAGQIPLWCDEGIAVLADPAEKQQRHERDFKVALDRGTAVRLGELLGAERYPSDAQRAVFYGESTSLVKFLLTKGSGPQLVQFIQRSAERGTDAALATTYGIKDVTELERLWRDHVQAADRRTIVALSDHGR